MSRPTAGSIVLVDWRQDALPREPARVRPAVVVEAHDRFPTTYANIVVVPLTRDAGLVIPTFSERLEPAPENGAEVTSWALGHHVTSVSLQRVTFTPSRITAAQLASLRQRIALALGID